MSNHDYLRAYTLADYFDRTGWMIGKTWKTALTVGGITLLVPAALIAAAVSRMFSVATSLAAASVYPADMVILRMLAGPMVLGIIASVLSGVGYLITSLAITHHARDVIFGEPQKPIDYLGVAFRESLGRVVVQMLLKGLLFGAMVAGPSLFIGVVVGITGGGGFVAFLAVVVVLVAGVAAIWLVYSLLLTAQTVVFDRDSALGGFSHSMRLVRGNWWRVFGITVLMQIILSFIVGIISTPIVGASFLPLIANVIRFATGEYYTETELLRALQGVGGIGFAAAVAVVVQQIITVFIMSPFYSLLFVDMKLRAGELRPTDAPHGGQEAGPEDRPTE